MLMGEFNHSIDEKGRVIIPAKFREQLGDVFVITKGLDGCLYGYPMSEWKVFEEKLNTLPLTNKDARKFVRFFLAGANEVQLDKQGRALISQVLREYAGLDKDVVLTGAGGHFEVWNRDKWTAMVDEYDDNMDEVAMNLSNLGFTI